jgi:aarF domain-containing kinase
MKLSLSLLPCLSVCTIFQNQAFAFQHPTYHTSTKKRKTQHFAVVTESIEKETIRNASLLFSRSTEIGSIVSSLLIPLLSSAASVAIQIQNNQENDAWEKYWLTESKGENNQLISNADRLVGAIEQLGPTYVKFGQAVASRPDIIPESLAESLSSLQDDMEAFDTEIAKEIIEVELTNANADKDTIAALLESLSEEPVAAASVGQVYKGYLPGVGDVAVKVQRPALKEMVEKDAALLRNVATFVESIPSPTSSGRLINTELVSAVDEFMSRVFEELDYTNEASNAKKFADLYSNKYGSARATLPNNGVIVPEIVNELCTTNVLVMEWIDGSKLTSFTKNYSQSDFDSEEESAEKKENLALIQQALSATLSQLLEFGVMHADPHAGNLLKVRDTTNSKEGTMTLAYLDFGLLATIPSTVRDGLVCAVAQLIFSKDVEAVANLFGELDLIEQDILEDPNERKALTEALTKTMEEVLVYPDGESISTPDQTIGTSTKKVQTYIPELKFDKLLDGLVRLVPRFKFQLPPYFINNARALGTLEGTARTLDPTFNAFSMMYPYALNRIMLNPTGSPVVDATLQKMVRCTDTGKIDRKKVQRLLKDSAAFTGFSRRKVLKDILKTKSGRKLAREAVGQTMKYAFRFRRLKAKTFSNYLRL